MTTPQTLDPYAVLGVTRDASAQQVAEAHRRLAKRYHPDVNRDAGATERMRRINEARHILSSRPHRVTHGHAHTPAGRWRPERRTAAHRDEWPPRQSTTWSTGGGDAASHRQGWTTWQPGDIRLPHTRRTTQAASAQADFGAGCAVLFIASALLLLLIRSPLY